jgi:DNA-binding transcriptional LysR family regulator
MDQLSAMQALLRVVDTGSFSAAARQLGVGQPAVSRAVARLEARLGVKLLARTTRGLSVTDAGQRYCLLARHALETVDEADAAARDAGAALSGRLRVAMAVSFGRLQIVPRLAGFMSAHPALAIDVVMDDRPIDLIEEGIDVALRLGPQPDSRFSGRIIATRRRIVVASPDYLARHDTLERPSDLARHEVVSLVQAGIATSWTFTRGQERETVTLGGRLRMTANEGVRAAVLAAMGLALGSEWGFEDEIADGRLVPVLADWQLPPSDLWAITPAGRQASAKARTFIGFVERQLKYPAPPLPD